jgi:hypothetical protein
MYTTLTQPKQRGKHPKRPHSTLPERQRARRRCASGSVCVAQCVCKGWRDHALCVRTDGRPPITTLQQRTLQTKACYKHRRPPCTTPDAHPAEHGYGAATGAARGLKLPQTAERKQLERVYRQHLPARWNWTAKAGA